MPWATKDLPISEGAAIDKVIRKFATFQEAKDEEYRYWQSVTPAERIAAACQLSMDAYRINGVEPTGEALRTTLVRFERQDRPS